MFETLTQSRFGTHGVGRSALSGAVLAHGVLVGVVLLASLVSLVSPGGDPPLPWFPPLIIHLSAPLGNPDAGGGGRHRAAPAAVSESRSIKETVQPQAIPEPEPPIIVPIETEAPPPDDSSQESPEDSSTQPEGPGSGPGEGPGEGPGHGPGRPGRPDGEPDGQGRPEDGPGDEPLTIRGDIRAPVLLVRIEPDYPEIARRARVEGVVIFEVVIGTDGRIERIQTLKSEPLLEGAARKAVARWVYTPALQHGRPVKVFATIRVEFRLN